LAAASTARPPTVPPLRPRPELSGMVGRRDSVVGARIGDRASLVAGLSGLWVAAGCAAVLVPGMIGVWLLGRASAAPVAHSVAMAPRSAATELAARPAPPVEIEPLAHLPAMMPDSEPAAAPDVKPAPGGRYYYHRRRRGSRAAAAAAMAAMTNGAPAPGSAGAGAPGAGGAAPAGGASAADDAPADSDQGDKADEPEKAPEKPKRVVVAEDAPEEPIGAPPRTVKELRSALARLQGRVVQCHQRFQVDGVADVKVAVNPSGTVESASLAGEFEGTPTGDCIVRAVSAASFPTFDGTESVRVSHSFPLQ
jgi:hypothetical protein